MRYKNYIHSSLLVLIGSVLLLGGCKKEEDLTAPDFKRETELLKRYQTPLDKWIKAEYTDPYNIEVIWRWDTKEAGYNSNYIPPRPENVQPFLTMLKQTFIKTYQEEMGNSFIKPLIPKQFMLLGEWGYQFGSRRLAQAEAGSKFVFYGVDYWDQKEDDQYPGVEYPFVREAVHTMFHEFGHILHQNKKFTEDFQSVSKKHYTIRWTDFSDTEARVKGFTSNYSMLNHNEDFVEILAFYITMTPEQWDAHISTGVEAAEKGLVLNPDHDPNPVDPKEAEEGRQAILTKLAMVRDYLKATWNIDLDEIRDAALKNAEMALKNPEIIPQSSASTRSYVIAPFYAVSPYTHNRVLCATGQHKEDGSPLTEAQLDASKRN